MISVSNKSKFWIYTLERKLWNKLIKTDFNYITSVVKYLINKNDIIFIYVNKGNVPSGFSAVITAKKSTTKNVDKIKIFNDAILNTYIVQVDEKMILKSPLNIKKIINDFKEEIDFKSSQSFSCKFIKGNLEFGEIQRHLGLKMLESIQKLDTKKKVKKALKKEIEKKKDISEKSQDNEEYIDELSDLEEIDLDINRSNIPILITSEEPIVINGKTFLKTLYVENNYEITNNNSYGFEKLKTKKNFKIITRKIYNDDDDDFEDALNAYHCLNPIISANVIIYKVLKHPIYEGSVLLVF